MQSGLRLSQFGLQERERLSARCVPIVQLGEPTIRSMLKLFKSTYENVDDAVFRRDLSAKSHVILVRNQALRLRGFSTLTIWPHAFEGREINLLFSGDTVVDQSAWGHQALPVAFLSAAGNLRSVDRSRSYYWLLTSKGHRTYRFLNLFFYRFWPQYSSSLEYEEALARDVGARFFPDRFDSSTSLLRGTELGRLRAEIAEIPNKDCHRPDVQFFIERNPGYAYGDELLCLAELCPKNMRPFARRVFQLNYDRKCGA